MVLLMPSQKLHMRCGSVRTKNIPFTASIDDFFIALLLTEASELC